MVRILFAFVSAFIIFGGLCRGICAQGQPESRNSQVGAKPPKTKLFEVPGFGGKMSQGALGGMLDALRDKKVHEEIGLLPSQLRELNRLNEEVMKEVGPMVENFNKLPKAEQADKVEQLRKDLAVYMKSVEADVDKILVAEQQRRLRQVAFQLRLQRNGALGTFTSPEVLHELGLNNVQADQFRENLTRIEEQHRSRLTELEIEKERKILALFSPSQQDRLEWMTGTSIRNLSKSPGGPKTPQP